MRIYFYDFQLLLKPKFSSIEKIKTIGSTYMLASGLRPGKEDNDSKVSIHFYLYVIVIYLLNL